MIKILVIEDDPSIRLGLEDTLKAKGYAVEAVTRGDTGLAAAQQRLPDLIVLDIMLPDMDGFEVCKQLKQSQGKLADVPVIFLSARGAELDRVRGFDLGADDYVTKPFSLMELLARVTAVLRRSGHGKGVVPDTLRFGDVEIQFKSQTTTKKGVAIELTSRAYSILRVFAARPGEVVSREELMNEAWGYDKFPNTRTVDNHIVKIRKALEDEADSPKHLLTVHGAGYRLVI